MHKLQLLPEFKRAASENLKNFCLRPNVGRFTPSPSALEQATESPPTSSLRAAALTSCTHTPMLYGRGGHNSCDLAATASQFAAGCGPEQG